jgi:hypothetical protein
MGHGLGSGVYLDTAHLGSGGQCRVDLGCWYIVRGRSFEIALLGLCWMIGVVGGVAEMGRAVRC